MGTSYKPFETVIYRVGIMPNLAGYIDGDVIGGRIELDVPGKNGGGLLNNIRVKDKDGTSSLLRFHFFRSQPTAVANNDAITGLTDTDWQEYWIGKVDIAAADYFTPDANSIGYVVDINNQIRAVGGKLWVYAQLNGDTATFTTPDALIFEFDFVTGD